MNFEIDYTLFRLKEAYFDHQSYIHGINHSYRVMYHVLQIATATGLKREGTIAFCAAYIHDLARMHDGYCTQHGTWAAERKLNLHANLFRQIGLKNKDLKKVEIAVAWHSNSKELEKSNHAYLVTALLKDADALDRIRLGEDDLDVRYLRFPETRQMVNSAKKLFYATDDKSFSSFSEIMENISELNKSLIKIKEDTYDPNS